MESIRQALERVRTLKRGDVGQAGQAGQATLNLPRQQFDSGVDFDRRPAPPQQVALDRSRLESHRIIAHDDGDPRAKSFDMLRTQVLQAMDQRNWKLLGITSPTPGCGKTVTAVNLAFSIARQPERSVVLVDLDLHKPQVASCLGFDGGEGGLFDVLEGRATLSSATVAAQAGNCRVCVLPTWRATSDSAAWIASRAMSTLLQDIKRDYQSSVVILDLPPMLSSDDVLAVLPQLDCGLLVAAVGRSTVGEIEECNRHLQSAEILRFVLNKVPERSSRYYYPTRPR